MVDTRYEVAEKGLTVAISAAGNKKAPHDEGLQGRTMNILQGDNLASLQRLKSEGAKFDLVELDGPYMAGLEDWDTITEEQYTAHYAERLTLVRDILQPWGVVFVFGYPEGCAEIKSWAHRTGTLYLRRWVHWYNNQAAHAPRRIQVINAYSHYVDDVFGDFRVWLKNKRKSLGITIEDAHNLTGIHPGCRGGYIWFESESSDIPSVAEYQTLKRFFDIPDKFDSLVALQPYNGLTNIDYITVPIETAAKLNDNGLRSKPVGLYLDLFKPTIPPTENKRALVLYGGSGNAAIAAGALGYDVTICEQSAARCEVIAGRWGKELARWEHRVKSVQPELPLMKAEQVKLFCD